MMGPGLLTIVSAPGPIAIGGLPCAAAFVLPSSCPLGFFFSPLLAGTAMQFHARQIDFSK